MKTFEQILQALVSKSTHQPFSLISGPCLRLMSGLSLRRIIGRAVIGKLPVAERGFREPLYSLHAVAPFSTTAMALMFNGYLRDKAKFYSPTPESKQDGATDVNQIDVAALLPEWKPQRARRDANMVDALIEALEKHLGDRPSPGGLDRYFQPVIDDDGMSALWQRNTSEPDARFMVQCALNALGGITRRLGYPVTIDRDSTPAEGAFASRVDFAFFESEEKKMLVEIKAPNILNAVAIVLERPGFPIRWLSGGTLEEKVISRTCLYMASHRSRWLALTSHDIWIFLRLHDHETDPYITYSSIERQTDNTRPFRALLGMMLDAQLDLNVKSRPEMAALLEPIASDVKPISGSSQDEADGEHRTHQGSGHSEVILPDTQSQNNNSNILISWSLRVTPSNMWFSLDAIDGTDQCASLGAKSVRFRLQHILGQGSTGVIYKALLDVDGRGEESESSVYAIKTVSICKSEDEKRRQRLHDEFNIYRLIEQARRKGDLGNVTSRCYGLFEDKHTSMLVMDCEGEALKAADSDWTSLTDHEKDEISDAVCKLHAIGINHCDLEPRNVVRTADGTFKIIDFSSSKTHCCKGIRSYSKRVAGDKKGAECNELKRLRKDLMKRK